MASATFSEAPARNAEPSVSAVALASVAGGLIAFGAFAAAAMSRNGWVFEYPLDDVYIHLSMAGQIARGGYGVNAGELASASSSPLYPLLLVPFSDTPLQRWLPLLWNIAALVAATALLGAAMARAGLGRAGLVLAALAPLALSMYLTAFTGMENMAHGAASLAIVLGLWHFVETGRIGVLLIAGTFLAPAFRLEGLALGLASGGVVALLGRPVAGLALAALTLVPVALFSGFLLSLGLDPLPNSVVAKLGDTGGSGMAGKFALNVQSYGGRYLFALAAVLTLTGAAMLPSDRGRGLFGLAVAAAAFAHLLFGATGWMDRYENYAVIAAVASLALLFTGFAPAIRITVLACVLVGGVFTYARYALPVYAWNPKAIAAQHGEMARFAKDFVRAPVAVNDIGYVAWRNPHYVLDLWGLASSEALAIRATGADAGWAGPLAEAKDVSVAMIYDSWVGEAVPSSWLRLGTLHLDVPDAFLGGPDVAFYATDPVHSERLRAALADWEKGLPERASFTYSKVGP